MQRSLPKPRAQGRGHRKTACMDALCPKVLFTSSSDSDEKMVSRSWIRG
jgi:hypothetical protein